MINLKKCMYNPIVKKLGFVLIATLYALCIIMLCSHIDVDSDKANHLLQAEDILAGNFFMSDWQLTGVTFFTTDLLYYEIAKVFCGVAPSAIFTACGLMIASVFIVGYFLSIVGKKDNLKLKIFLFIAILAIPCREYVFHFRVHTGAVFLCLIAFLLTHHMLSADKKVSQKKYAILLFLCLLFGAIGDMLAVIEGIVPIMIICFFELLNTKQAEKKKVVYEIIGIALSAVVCSVLWDKIFFSIGGANKNSYIEIIKFSSTKEWGNKFLKFISYIMNMCMANFGGKKINNIWNLLMGINFLVMIISFIMIIRNIYCLIRQKIEELDIISVLLSCSVVMSFLAYILTSMAEARYIAIIPIACGIIFIRNISLIIKEINNKQICMGCIFILAFLVFAGRIKEISTYIQYVPNNDKEELIEFLEKHDLENGYASFWNASVLTVLSENHIKVRHIEANGDKMDMRKWFAKNEWYLEDARYVIIDNSNQDGGDSDSFGVSENNTQIAFGVPFEKYEVGNYIVLVYDSDLSPKLLSYQ